LQLRHETARRSSFRRAANVHRQPKRRPVSSVDELLDVAGMTEAKVDRLSPQIIVP